MSAGLHPVERDGGPVRGESTPAPKAYLPVDSDGYVEIEVLCPERAMTHFAFGRFTRAQAEAVHLVRCPVCCGSHRLVSPAAWVAGIAEGA